jgi:adenine-specific DNA-methyltransferase
LDVITRIIAGCSDRGEIVMDPFMGSGTTAVAAIAQGRRVVGFEIRESYCALSKQRIEDYIRQERYERLQTVLSV